MARKSTLGWMVALPAMLTGCAPPSMFDVNPVPQSELVGVSPSAARDKLVATMQQLGMVTEVIGDDRLTIRASAPSPPAAWGRCPVTPVRDPYSDSGRSEFVQPISSRAQAIVRISTIADRTSVAIEAELFGTYPQPFTNTSFELACPRTGELERRILAALD